MRASTADSVQPIVFGFVAGFVDVCGYVALGGLFTAHITGNLAVLGAAIVGHPNHLLLRLLALPAFAVAVAAGRLGADLLERGGRPVLRPLVLAELALLAAFMACGAAGAVRQHPEGEWALAAAAAAVGAMGVQNAALGIAARGTVLTTAMTGNLTRFTLAALDLVVPAADQPPDQARRSAIRSGQALGAFAIGAAAGGFGYLGLDIYALAVPMLALAALLLTLPPQPRVPSG